MKMRYKVNFHVLLYFLSSCSQMMGSQAPNISSQNENNGIDTEQPNTFLINVNNDENVASQRTTHLASINDNHAFALSSNNETIQTNHTKFQTSKFYIDNKF